LRACVCPKNFGRVEKLMSFVEIEVAEGKINILERAGDGKTKEIVELLKAYGLKLNVKVDAPCG